jgi:Outer membrane protein beta-barrel domain
MKHIKTQAKLMTLFAAISSLACAGYAQSRPTASRQMELSAFAGGTGTFTRIEGGKNLGITAGVDLTLLSFRLLRPSVEVRGSYPIDEGTIDSQKNFLIGPKVEHRFGRLHPYVDFLIGRGEIDYHNGGFPLGSLLYLSSKTTVYSPGGGVDYDLGKGLAVKADVQIQHWDAPVVSSGVIYPVALTLGAMYHFGFGSGHPH